MFVNEERCGTEVLCHECLHMALAYERHVLLFGMGYGEFCGENEERLAYFLGEDDGRGRGDATGAWAYRVNGMAGTGIPELLIWKISDDAG